jgi:hypothetical protein
VYDILSVVVDECVFILVLFGPMPVGARDVDPVLGTSTIQRNLTTIGQYILFERTIKSAIKIISAFREYLAVKIRVTG